VKKDASAADIKKAYFSVRHLTSKRVHPSTNSQKLARKYHPDTNPDKNAREKFVEIQEAYDVRLHSFLSTIHSNSPSDVEGRQEAASI
jgi:molecular chaperone DnaJ